MTTAILVFLMLLPLSPQGAKRQVKEDFGDFCSKFYSDSTFQRERIKYPLISVSREVPAGPVDTVFLRQEQWQYSDYGYMANKFNIQVYDNFKKRLRSSAERVVSFEGVENGISLSFYFQRIEDRWYLVKQENVSD